MLRTLALFATAFALFLGALGVQVRFVRAAPVEARPGVEPVGPRPGIMPGPRAAHGSLGRLAGLGSWRRVPGPPAPLADQMARVVSQLDETTEIDREMMAARFAGFHPKELERVVQSERRRRTRLLERLGQLVRIAREGEARRSRPPGAPVAVTGEN